MSLLADTTVALADVPLNETDAGAVKPVPFTVTVVPIGPDVGEIDVTVGPGGGGEALVTVNVPELTIETDLTLSVPVVAPVGD